MNQAEPLYRKCDNIFVKIENEDITAYLVDDKWKRYRFHSAKLSDYDEDTRKHLINGTGIVSETSYTEFAKHKQRYLLALEDKEYYAG